MCTDYFSCSAHSQIRTGSHWTSTSDVNVNIDISTPFVLAAYTNVNSHCISGLTIRTATTTAWRASPRRSFPFANQPEIDHANTVRHIRETDCGYSCLSVFTPTDGDAVLGCDVGSDSSETCRNKIVSWCWCASMFCSTSHTIQRCIPSCRITLCPRSNIRVFMVESFFCILIRGL